MQPSGPIVYAANLSRRHNKGTVTLKEMLGVVLAYSGSIITPMGNRLL